MAQCLKYQLNKILDTQIILLMVMKNKIQFYRWLHTGEYRRSNVYHQVLQLLFEAVFEWNVGFYGRNIFSL
jgi:hypothetical protein